ncbi:MAG: vanadium-dependent haloperoxidase [Cyanobacteria bacterium P01_A01_bin.40]
MVDLNLEANTQLVTVSDPDPTVSVVWDQAVQQAVVNTSPGPTVASRAYSLMHTAIFDAWAAYDPVAIATTFGDNWQRPKAEDTNANKQKAMSYAAYEVVSDLFPGQIHHFDRLMAEYDYELEPTGASDLTTPEGIGQLAADSILQSHYDDGSNQLGENSNGDLGIPYSDISGYEYPNQDEHHIVDLDLWTPENVTQDDESRLQQFLTPHWGQVNTFAQLSSQLLPPPPEPFLLVEGKTDLKTKTITIEDGTTVDIDRSLIGTVINPKFIAQAEEVVDYSANLTDEQKLIAEFWEDGGGTSFPPGTWMTFGQYVSARDDHTLDEDAQLFFMLGNAVCDAGIASWQAKSFYNYARPVRTIRELGKLGLIGEYDKSLGGYAIEAWQPGRGTQKILATDFVTYQTPESDPSPPFAEYTSGHSAFSAAAALILKLVTGSNKFGGEVTFKAGDSRFEPGLTPADEVTKAWNTFSQAADEAGESRLYGGIHFSDGDQYGRWLGRKVAHAVYNQGQFYIDGGHN